MSISLKKLIDRYNKAVKFNYDISSEGLIITKDVIEFIKEKKLQGLKYSSYNNQYYIANKKLILPSIVIKKPSDKTIIKSGVHEVNIEISKHFNEPFSFFLANQNTIVLGNMKPEFCNSEEEYLQLLADSITHEFIHKLLKEEFNLVVCKLFDVIADNFRQDEGLLQKYVNRYNWKYSTGYRLHVQAIIEDGIELAIYRNYHIDKTDLTQAYIIANYRLQEA